MEAEGTGEGNNRAGYCLGGCPTAAFAPLRELPSGRATKGKKKKKGKLDE